MVIPCLVNRVDVCANTMAYIKLVAHIGPNRINAFASSTSVMLQTDSYSFEPSAASNALLRNLPIDQ